MSKFEASKRVGIDLPPNALPTKTDINAIKRKLERLLERSPAIASSKSMPTLAEYGARFVEAKASGGIGDQSVKSYRRAARYLSAAISPETRLDRITRPMLERFVSRLAAGELDSALDPKRSHTGPKSPVTISNIVAAAKAMFRHAVVVDRLIPENPMAGVSYDATPPEKPECDFIPIETSLGVTLINAALGRKRRTLPIRPGSNEAWAAAIALALFGGLRASEVRNLRVNRLDLEGKHCGIPGMWVRNAKTFKKARNRPEYRFVPVGEYLASVIRKALATLGPEDEFVVSRTCIKSKNTISDCGWLFRLAGVAHIPEFWQNCRRSRAQELSRELPLKAHCEILGHTPEVAMRYYLRLEADQLRRAAAIGPAVPTPEQPEPGPTTTTQLRLAV